VIGQQKNDQGKPIQVRRIQSNPQVFHRKPNNSQKKAEKNGKTAQMRNLSTYSLRVQPTNTPCAGTPPANAMNRSQIVRCLWQVQITTRLPSTRHKGNRKRNDYDSYDGSFRGYPMFAFTNKPEKIAQP